MSILCRSFQRSPTSCLYHLPLKTRKSIPDPRIQACLHIVKTELATSIQRNPPGKGPAPGNQPGEPKPYLRTTGFWLNWRKSGAYRRSESQNISLEDLQVPCRCAIIHALRAAKLEILGGLGVITTWQADPRTETHLVRQFKPLVLGVQTPKVWQDSDMVYVGAGKSWIDIP